MHEPLVDDLPHPGPENVTTLDSDYRLSRVRATAHAGGLDYTIMTSPGLRFEPFSNRS